MLMRNRSGNPRDELPGEEQDLLKAILQLLIVPKTLSKLCGDKENVSILTSGYFKPEEIRWFLLVFKTLLSRFFKAGVTLGSDSSAMVLLPADRHSYEEHRLKLPEYMHLRPIFGKGRITYRLSRKIIKALCLVSSYKKRGPRRTHALVLQDPRSWYLRKFEEDPSITKNRLFVLLARFARASGFQWSAGGCVAFKEHDVKITVEDFDIQPLQNELDRINDFYPKDMKSIFRLDWIWGKNPMDHNRLYSRFCNSKKWLREYILLELDFAESDITAAYWRILYLIYTGSPFSHSEFGEDLYAFLASKIWPEYPHPEHYRYIVKHILSISIGATRNQKTNSMLNKVSEELAKIGVGIGKSVHKEYTQWTDETRGKYRTVRLDPGLLDRRWHQFCTDAMSKVVGHTIPRPDIKPQAFLDALFSETVIRDNAFIGVFRVGMWAETLCNIQLLEWGRSQGIVIATIHDGCYAPRQHIEKVSEMQEYFLRIAAGVYRKILAYQKEYHNRWELKRLTEDQRRSIARDCLAECSESIRQVYEHVVMYFFTPMKIQKKKATRCLKQQENEETLFMEAEDSNISADCMAPSH